MTRFPAVAFIVKLKIFSVRGSWITECCWTTRPPPNLKAAVQLQRARMPLKVMSGIRMRLQLHRSFLLHMWVEFCCSLKGWIHVAAAALYPCWKIEKAGGGKRGKEEEKEKRECTKTTVCNLISPSVSVEYVCDIFYRYRRWNTVMMSVGPFTGHFQVDFCHEPCACPCKNTLLISRWRAAVVYHDRHLRSVPAVCLL